MKKISGVYKIENIITGDFYIGNGVTLSLDALRSRFSYAGIEHQTLEAKKYLKG